LGLLIDVNARRSTPALDLAYTVDGTITATVDVLHTDGLGSVRAITDSNGSVVQTFQSNEFGVPLLTQRNSPEPFRYTGQQRDAESGFYDLRAWYYSPGLGRYLSRDSAFGFTTSPLSLDHYAYASGNPINVLDPSGNRGGSYETGNFGCWAQETPGDPSGIPVEVGNQAINQVSQNSYADPSEPTNPNSALSPAETINPTNVLISGPGISGYGKLDYLLGRLPGNAASVGRGDFFQIRQGAMDPVGVAGRKPRAIGQNRRCALYGRHRYRGGGNLVRPAPERGSSYGGILVRACS
jgi:RHS repeat-associated protein